MIFQYIVCLKGINDMDKEYKRKQRLKIIDELPDLRLLFEQRNNLIVIYSNLNDSDKYISTMEIIQDMEKIIWDRIDNIEANGDGID